MAHPQSRNLPTPPASTSSPALSNTSFSSLLSSLPAPRSRPLQPGSRKEISLINYLDKNILKITRRYGKKFSNEGIANDDTPGYTHYDQFVLDADPLVDVVWVSATPSLEIPYLLQIAGFACSYLPAFSFSTSLFPLVRKIDQAFAAILQSGESSSGGTTIPSKVNMTEKVRIKSLIEETRIAAVNVATSTGYDTSLEDVSEVDTEDYEAQTEDDDLDNHDANLQNMPVSMALSKIYEKTLEILGDSLVNVAPPQPQDDDTSMT